MTSTLQSLLSRVEAAEGPSRELDAEIGLVVDHDEFMQDSEPHYYTESLDAALALVERVLPGWGCSITVALGGGSTAEVFNASGRRYDCNGDKNINLSEWLDQGNIHRPTPALALLAALLRALLSKDPQHAE